MTTLTFLTLAVSPRVNQMKPLNTMVSDDELIQACRAGDTEAFRWLYRRYQGRVRSTLYQLCAGASLDDLVQEVFLRAWKGLPRFRQSAQFSTWLYRIVWNVASDCRRQRARTRAQQQQLPQLVSVAHDPAGLTHLHYQDLVQRGLQQLSLEHRDVLVLHDLEQLPQAQVAQILGIPVGTVKSRLHHGRAQLRQFLQREGISL